MDIVALNQFYETELKLLMETGEVSESLEELCEKIKSKVDIYYYLTEKIESEEGFAKRTKEKWGEYERALGNRRKRILEAIKTVCMTRDGMTLAGNEVEFKVHANGKKTLKVIEEKAIADAYFKETVIRELDKETLKSDIDLGILSPVSDGWSYQESFSLRSKLKSPEKLEAPSERTKKSRASQNPATSN